jgi:hypothetical protein
MYFLLFISLVLSSVGLSQKAKLDSEVKGTVLVSHIGGQQHPVKAYRATIQTYEAELDAIKEKICKITMSNKEGSTDFDQPEGRKNYVFYPVELKKVVSESEEDETLVVYEKSGNFSIPLGADELDGGKDLTITERHTAKVQFSDDTKTSITSVTYSTRWEAEPQDIENARKTILDWQQKNRDIVEVVKGMNLWEVMQLVGTKIKEEDFERASVATMLELVLKDLDRYNKTIASFVSIQE